MGSTPGGGTTRPPTTPEPQVGNVAPYGATAAFNPQFQSFLPGDPTAMATGLTPQMFQQAPPAPTQQVAPTAGGAGAQQQGQQPLSPAVIQSMLAQGATPQSLISMGADPRDVAAATMALKRGQAGGERASSPGRSGPTGWGGGVAGGVGGRSSGGLY